MMRLIVYLYAIDKPCLLSKFSKQYMELQRFKNRQSWDYDFQNLLSF